MTGDRPLHLRLICAAVPLAVAGLRFGRGPVRAYGVIQRPLDQFDEAELRALFAEPRIDVSLGIEAPSGDFAFVPVADQMDLTRVAQLLTPLAEQPELSANAKALLRRDTLHVIADHLAAEQARDAALPGGDDEEMPDTGASPATEAELHAILGGGLSDGAQALDAPPAAAPEAAAATPAVVPPVEPELDVAETASLLAEARWPDGIQVNLTTKPAGTKRASRETTPRAGAAQSG